MKIVNIMTSDVRNENGRIYPREVIEEAIGRVQVEHEGCLYGGIGPQDGTLSLDSLSHAISNLRLTKDGDLIGDLKVLQTAQGAVLQTLLELNPIDFGMSGIGVIWEDGVVSDFRIVSISAVYNGA